MTTSFAPTDQLRLTNLTKVLSPNIMSREIAIGDIHGCSRALEALIQAIQPGPDDVMVTLGDYIDWGSEREDVISGCAADYDGGKFANASAQTPATAAIRRSLHLTCGWIEAFSSPFLQGRGALAGGNRRCGFYFRRGGTGGTLRVFEGRA